MKPINSLSWSVWAGREARPEEEIATRQSVKLSFDRKNEQLTRRLDALGPDLKRDVSELIGHLRTGDVDLAAEAEAAFNGTSNGVIDTTG